MNENIEHLDSVKESIDDDIRQLRTLRNMIINNKNILNKDVKEWMIVTLNQVLSSLAQSNWKILNIDPDKLNKESPRDKEKQFTKFKKDKQIIDSNYYWNIHYNQIKEGEDVYECFDILDWEKVQWFNIQYLWKDTILININYDNFKGIFTSQILQLDVKKVWKQPKILLFTN